MTAIQKLPVARGATESVMGRGDSQKAPSMMWMVVPAVLFTLLMIGFPILYSGYLSLNDLTLGRSMRFIGVGNYTALMNDPLFWNGLRITVVLYVLSISLQLILGVYLGILLNRVIQFRGVLRTIMISPFVMPPVVVGMMWMVILDPSLGVANYLLESAGLPTSAWLASPQMVIPTMAIIDTWQWTPFVALIVLGGLQSLPNNVYEAAEIDGVSRRRVFWYITLPMLGPTIVTAAVLRSVDVLRFFDLIYITTQGGPGNASMTLNILAYRTGFEFFDIGYAAAIMVTLSTIVLGTVIALSGLRKRVSW